MKLVPVRTQVGAQEGVAVKTANSLHDRPQHHELRVHIKHRLVRTWDSQLLLNGTIAERAYELRAIDTSLPFPELKRESHINARPPAPPMAIRLFSTRIREGLP